MSKWTYAMAATLAVAITLPAVASAQSGTLTDKDRAAIKQLSDNYVTYLDGCKSTEYANLFASDGSFVSGPRGTMTGPEKLAGLVTSERFCQPGATTKGTMSHAFSKIVIEPSATGATGKVYLPGRNGASGGHYEDTYVKTPEGWKFKTRQYLSPKEESAQ